VPGCRAAVDDGTTGLLVPAQDSAALAKAMLRFIEDPSLAEAFGQRAYVVAKASMRAEDRAKELLDMVELISASAGQASGAGEPAA
jgi:glycosyltransferase involved in cell wall biosynthesis